MNLNALVNNVKINEAQTKESVNIPPASLLPQSWDVFFRNANAGAPPGAAYQSPLGLTEAPQLSSLVGAQPNVEKLVEDHLAVQSLIRAYQVETHTHSGRSSSSRSAAL